MLTLRVPFIVIFSLFVRGVPLACCVCYGQYFVALGTVVCFLSPVKFILALTFFSFSNYNDEFDTSWL